MLFINITQKNFGFKTFWGILQKGYSNTKFFPDRKEDEINLTSHVILDLVIGK